MWWWMERQEVSGRDSTIGDGRRRLGGGWRDKKCQGETPPSVMAEEGLVVDGETRSVRERLHHR